MKKQWSFYLCGPVEHDPSANDWRVDITSLLHQNINDDVVIYNPMEYPKWSGSGPYNFDHVFDKTAYFEQSDTLEDTHKANQILRKMSKRLASQCDILIARLPKTFTWGSIDELEICLTRGIPVFLWLPGGNSSMYGLSGMSDNPRYIKQYISTEDNEEDIVNKISVVLNGESDLPELEPTKWIKLTWS